MSDQRAKFSDKEALLFHSANRLGKLEIIASKPMATQRDLSLAYSPGVAVPEPATAALLGLGGVTLLCRRGDFRGRR